MIPGWGWGGWGWGGWGGWGCIDAPRFPVEKLVRGVDPRERAVVRAVAGQLPGADPAEIATTAQHRLYPNAPDYIPTNWWDCDETGWRLWSESWDRLYAYASNPTRNVRDSKNGRSRLRNAVSDLFAYMTGIPLNRSRHRKIGVSSRTYALSDKPYDGGVGSSHGTRNAHWVYPRLAGPGRTMLTTGVPISAWINGRKNR